MSERTLSELANAEIVPDMGGENGWLVRFDEGDYDTINKSAKNTLLVKGMVEIDDTVSYGGIMVDFDLENDDIVLHDGDNSVDVPADRHENVLWAIYDEDAPRLCTLFDDLYVPTVRQGLMDMLMPRFRRDGSEIQKTEDGWLLNEEILLSWDASNSPVNDVDTHIVRGGSTVEANTDKEAREITFNLSDDTEVLLPNGTETDLDETEMKFLVSAALILGHEANDFYQDGLTESIQQSRIDAFTDTKSGLAHNHPLTKHDVRDLGVTEEAVEKLWSHSYDHTGVVEMAMRENEFSNAPFDVFEDASNDSIQKWKKIHSTKKKAPIPKHVRSMLEDMYQ